MAIIDLENEIRWNGHLIGMDSYYTSIPVMLQLAFWGIKGIGTLNVKRKGLGAKLAEWKKHMTKD